MNKETLISRIYETFPKDSIGKYDLLPLFKNPELFDEIISYLAKPFYGKADYVVSPEAMGFILGTGLAKKLGVGFVALRKENKLPYFKSDLHSASYKDYSGTNKTIEIKKGTLPKGCKVIICDDWIESAAVLEASIKLIEKECAVLCGIASVGSEYNNFTKNYIDNGFLNSILCEKD